MYLFAESCLCLRRRASVEHVDSREAAWRWGGYVEAAIRRGGRVHRLVDETNVAPIVADVAERPFVLFARGLVPRVS